MDESQISNNGPVLPIEGTPSDAGNGAPSNSIIGRVKSVFSRAGRHKSTCQCGKGECGKRMRAAAKSKAESKKPAESNQFAAPELPANVVAVDFAAGEQVEIGSPADLQPAQADFTDWGKAGGALISGLYTLRNLFLRRKAERKLPAATVNSLVDTMEVPASIVADLESGYAALARELGADSKYGWAARLGAAHINLEIHYQKQVSALVKALAALPDIQQAA